MTKSHRLLSASNAPGAAATFSALLHRAVVLMCALTVLLQCSPLSSSSLLTAASAASASRPSLAFVAPAGVVDQFGGGDHFSECAQLAAGDEERLLLCQLYESSALLGHLSMLINEGIGRLAVSQGMGGNVPDAGREKRKHEYLRFGKRKHEYLRFGRK